MPFLPPPKSPGKLKTLENTVREFQYECSSNSFCAPFTVYLNPGKYKLEVWGAKGGDGYFKNILRPGGNGGYSKGELSILKKTRVFVNVGGSGQSIQTGSLVEGGNNGGGSNSDIRSDFQKSSGGGGTDIRLHIDDLFHRVIVAGGGGGGNGASSGGAANGGVGGGFIGGKSPGHYSFSNDYSPADGSGGTQTTGGKMGIGQSSSSLRNKSPQPNGIFGFGGNIAGDNVMAGGGGGGWYGGGAGNGHGGAGGGGSGFALNSTTFTHVPLEYKLGSESFLSNSETIPGDQQIILPTGISSKGNPNHGFARISFLSPIKRIPFSRYKRIKSAFFKCLIVFLSKQIVP